MNALEWEERLGFALGVSLAKESIDLTKPEDRALAELIEEGSQRLAQDEASENVESSFDPQGFVDVLVASVVELRSQHGKTHRDVAPEISAERIRSRLCPLYPIC